ncbi:hypothetical protein PNEG_01859 [Pneumocystis murina B123]|uniref:Transcription regulator Rua1 C-terminal domain-containing protein n=1 Tax=Pneumocystis murina (strain B123) TaxID=1069680 RepID=M7PGT3_PNEMU|nr:hypothetical protein PNEG_01859 [Pneumocystis murina B123]EMR09669.1 hypothetical protein PNEG_01859 [Pneumocystis murina B123]
MKSEKDLSYAFRRNACDMFLTSTVNMFSSAYIPEKARASIAVWQDDIVDGGIVDIKCIENIQSISSHSFNGNIVNLNESSVSEELSVLESSTRVDNFSIHEEELSSVLEVGEEGDWLDKVWVDENRRRVISSSINGRRPLAALSTNTLALKKKEIYSSIALCESALQYDPVYTCNSSATIFSITPSLTEFCHSTPTDHKTTILSVDNSLNDEFSNTHMNSSTIEENTIQKRKDTLALSSFVLAQFRTKRISTLRATTLGKRVGQELTKLSKNVSCKRLFPNNKRTIVAGRQFRRVRQKATEDEVEDLLLKSEFSHSHIQNIYSTQKFTRPSYIYSKRIDFLDNNIALKSESSSDSSHSSNFYSPLSSRPSLPLSTQRTFPENIPIHPDFFRYYLAHPRFTYSNGNPPIQYDVDDLYNPRYIKGIGINKMGMCPICCENIERGGQGKEVWLKMKISAFWYHMNFFHGINPTTALPYSPPVSFRTVPLVTMNANGISKKKKASGFTSIPDRKEILEGKCHKCKKWVRVQGIKEQEVKVAEIFWWKHARSCHGTSRIKGEGCEMR